MGEGFARRLAFQIAQRDDPSMFVSAHGAALRHRVEGRLTSEEWDCITDICSLAIDGKFGAAENHLRSFYPLVALRQ